MKIKVEVDVSNISVKKLMGPVQSDKFWKYAAQEWHRLYKDYVPMKTGVLYNSVTIEPKTITHYVPYAHYIYEGRVYGPNYPITENGVVVGYFSQRNRRKKRMRRMLKFSRELHPKASRQWDKAAAPVQKPALIRTLQAYVDSGRLNLNG